MCSIFFAVVGLMDFEFILAYKLDLKYPCKPDYFDFPVFKY